MGSERRGRAVHGRVEVNPSGEEPTDRPRQKNAGLWEPYDGRLSRTVLREREGEVPSRHSPRSRASKQALTRPFWKLANPNANYERTHPLALTSLVCPDLAKWGDLDRVLPKLMTGVYPTFRIH